MSTQRRNYKHGDQKHLHRSIMAITSGPKYLKHKNIVFYQYIIYQYLGTLYTLDLFMRIKNNATRKAVKTIILTFRLASSNHYQLKNGRRHKPKLTMLLQ